MMFRSEGMNESSRKLFSLLLAGMFAVFFSACTVDEEESAAVAGGDELEGETADEVSDIEDADTSVFSVSVAAPVGDRYVTYATENGDHSTPCIAEAGDSIICIIDIDELDLWHEGLTIRNTVPDTCYYRGFRPYHFQRVPLSTQTPECVYYHVNEDGDVSNLRWGIWNPDDPEDRTTGCGVFDSVIGVPSTAVQYVYDDWNTVDPLNLLDESRIAEEGDVVCPYDYSAGPTKREGGSNCCLGQYDAHVYNSDTGEGDSTTSNEWGGNLSGCFGGAAVDSQEVDENGWIQAVTTNVPAEAGFAEDYAIAKEDARAGTASSVWAANYFNSSDHTGDYPFPFVQFDPDEPTYFESHYSFPYYRFDCLDQNMEVISRIDVLVREWDEQGEMTSNDSPNSGGNFFDSNSAEDSPYDNEIMNDMWDWRDWDNSDSHDDFYNRWPMWGWWE